MLRTILDGIHAVGEGFDDTQIRHRSCEQVFKWLAGKNIIFHQGDADSGTGRRTLRLFCTHVPPCPFHTSNHTNTCIPLILICPYVHRKSKNSYTYDAAMRNL